MRGNPVSVEQGRTRREQILTFLQVYIAEHGYSPSFTEIGQGCGISITSVSRHLYQLRDEGRIRMGEGPRTLALIERNP